MKRLVVLAVACAMLAGCGCMQVEDNQWACVVNGKCVISDAEGVKHELETNWTGLSEILATRQAAKAVVSQPVVPNDCDKRRDGESMEAFQARCPQVGSLEVK